METIKEKPIAEKKEFSKAYYNEAYKYGYNWESYMRLADKMLEILVQSGASDKRICDVGCGVGWFSDRMRYNVSKKIDAVDFSEKAINFHGRRMYPMTNFFVADIYEFDYTNYEVFVLMEVMEHINNDMELLGKFPKGSMVFMTVPYEKERKCEMHVREYTLESARARYEKYLDIRCCYKYEQFIILWGIKKW